jgi:hypothetical protein
MQALEVELNKSPYENLAAVHEALLYWPDNDDRNGDYGYVKTLETRGRQAMAELVEFMGKLPERYSYRSVDEYILGYVRADGALDSGEAEALRQWNVMLRGALRIGGEQTGKFDVKAKVVLQMLLEDVCEFSMGRHERAMMTLSARLIGQSKGTRGRMSLWEASVPFLEVGEGAEREALVEVSGPEV